MTLSLLPTSLLLLLAASAPHRASALSSHSPTDLYAFPRYQVSLGQDGVLNETVAELLAAAVAGSEDDDGDELINSKVTRRLPGARHLLRTPAGQAFLCTVPAASHTYPDAAQAGGTGASSFDVAAREAESERGLERGLALLEPLRGTCLYQRQNWFTYSFCYGKVIRQFHEEDRPQRLPGTSQAPVEDLKSDSYTLGLAPEPVSTTPPRYGSGSGAVDRQYQRVPASLGGGVGGSELGFGEWDSGAGGRYLSQIWDDGTICDKTNLPRTVEVQFHCNTGTMDRIALIRETSICRYVMIIHTPRLCSEALFLEGRADAFASEPASHIECQPVVSKLRSTVDASPKSPPASIDPLAEGKTEAHAEKEPTVGLDPALKQGQENGNMADEPPRLGLDVSVSIDPEAAGPPRGPKSDSDDSGFIIEEADVGDMVDVLTLVYDPETGETYTTISSEGDGGENVVLPGGSGESQQDGGQAGEGALGGEAGPTVKGLEELTKLMRESIADALRQHAAERDEAQQPGQQQRPPEPNRGDPSPQQAAAQAADDPRANVPQSLHAILKNLARGAGAAEPQRTVLGEEEHRRLKENFGRVWDDDDGDDRSEKEQVEGRTRDEL